jgi:sugar phosphate isomerase/epimerase
VALYAAAGIDAIGVWELKLPAGSEQEALEALERSGLGSAAAVPATPSILPLPLMEGPSDPQARIDAICASVHRLAPFRPSGIVCLTGPGAARETVVDGLRTIAGEAERAGIRIGLEPINRVGGENWTMISSLGEAVELVEDADHPALGLQFDTWHLWNAPDVVGEIRRYADRFVGVHVADWREPTRSWCDRVLPGDGVADLPALLGALEAAGWSGYYEVEIFSDNGTFGNAWEDSLWDVSPRELVRLAKESFKRVWERRIRPPVDQVSPGAV